MYYLVFIYFLGKPVDRPEDIDYVPTVFAFKHRQLSAARSEERRNRIDRRRRVAEAQEHEEENQREKEDENQREKEYERDCQEVAAEGLLLLQQSCKAEAGTQTTSTSPVRKCAGTQASCSAIEYKSPSLCSSKLLEGNDECTKFYTGLTAWAIFTHLVTFLFSVSPSLSATHLKLSPSDSLLLTLMRLRLNLRIEDLAYRFNIGSSTASDIFNRYIDVMYINLKFLIKWPSQETCRTNMPQVFKDLYPRTRCIVDCSEIFIEQPCSYQTRAQTYSNYKKHNTVKFLIGITLCGAISYLSKCWGGRATDKCITMNSDFLPLLE